MSALSFDYVVPGDDFTQAGAASSDVKRKLKKIGYDADVIRRVAIAMYEGEINMVIHAGGGTAHVEIDSDKIYVILEDHPPRCGYQWRMLLRPGSASAAGRASRGQCTAAASGPD